MQEKNCGVYKISRGILRTALECPTNDQQRPNEVGMKKGANMFPKELPISEITERWTSNPTSNGRCGFENISGIDIRKYVMRLHGNLASGSKRGGPFDR